MSSVETLRVTHGGIVALIGFVLHFVVLMWFWSFTLYPEKLLKFFPEKYACALADIKAGLLRFPLRKFLGEEVS